MSDFISSFTTSNQICNPTDNRRVAVKYGKMFTKIRLLSIATQRIVVRSQFGKREMKELLELHNLRTNHVLIQSQPKYLIGGKVMWLKCRVFDGKTGPIAMVRVFVW
jgi:hypothetical protein